MTEIPHNQPHESGPQREEGEAHQYEEDLSSINLDDFWDQEAEKHNWEMLGRLLNETLSKNSRSIREITADTPAERVQSLVSTLEQLSSLLDDAQTNSFEEQYDQHIGFREERLRASIDAQRRGIEQRTGQSITLASPSDSLSGWVRVGDQGGEGGGEDETRPDLELEDGDEFQRELKKVRSICNSFEGIDGFVAEKSDLYENKNLTRLVSETKEVSEELAAELEARAVLHDAFMVFAIADYGIEGIDRHKGNLNLGAEHFETLLHGMYGVRELVPIALGMFEMALKGKLKGLKGVNAGSWSNDRETATNYIASKLGGENGGLAAKIAFRLTECTGMPAYYEDDFRFEKTMPQRDVMNTEGRRKYYGNPDRVGRTGRRYHGFSTTVGAYWNYAGETNKKGEDVNAVITIPSEKVQSTEIGLYEAGVPQWDLIPDFWEDAKVLDPRTREAERFGETGQQGEISPIKTLARRNRYQQNESPDVDQLEQRLKLEGGDSNQINTEVLKNLEWGQLNVVRYDQLKFVGNINGEERSIVDDRAHRQWAEQFSERLRFHQMITDPEGPSVEEIVSGVWLTKNQTNTDYLPITARGLRDLEGVKRDEAVRKIQAIFLWSVLHHHNPLFQQDKALWVNPRRIREAILTTVRLGYVSKNQGTWIENNMQLSKALLYYSIRSNF